METYSFIATIAGKAHALTLDNSPDAQAQLAHIVESVDVRVFFAHSRSWPVQLIRQAGSEGLIHIYHD